MTRALLWLAILIGCATPVLAQAPAYPKDVQAVFDFAKKSCLDEGGTSVAFSDKDVRKVDRNGDGREDYIVHLQNAECPAPTKNHSAPARDPQIRAGRVG